MVSMRHGWRPIPPAACGCSTARRSGWRTCTACTVRPCEENPDPPRLTMLPQATWQGEAVALATAPAGRLGVLVWRTGDDARLCVQGDHANLDVIVRLRGIHFPYSFAWTS